MNLSVNQNRQFFAINDENHDLTNNQFTANSQGSFFKAYTDGDEGDPHIYFTMKGSDGQIRRSDLIRADHILGARATLPKKTPVQRTKITIDANHTLLVGQQYVMNITLNNFVGVGAENTYIKHGAVLATSTTASNFYFAMAKSIAQNFHRELNPFVKVYLTYSTSSVSNEVTWNADASDFTETYTGIILQGQDIDADGYVPGVTPDYLPDFTVSGNMVHNVTGNYDENWIAVTDDTANSTITVTNTRTVQDMEYFCMGERADQYRMKGFPHVIYTNYDIPKINNATDDGEPVDWGWCLLDIHYCYTGDNESIQKSEKTLTIAMPATAENEGVYSSSEFTKLVNRFNALSGQSISAQ